MCCGGSRVWSRSTRPRSSTTSSATTTGTRRAASASSDASGGCTGRASPEPTGWSPGRQWAKDGLVDDYGVPPDKVVVIPPGVDYDRWAARGRSRDEVDGDDRSGSSSSAATSPGRAAARSSTRCDACAPAAPRSSSTSSPATTSRPRTASPCTTAWDPNSPALIELYRSADIFCLPTLGDCLPMVLSEAGAAGLPLVSTDVGAIREIVRPEQTGLLVPPGDEVALAAALERLDRRSGACGGRSASTRNGLVREDFNAATNASRLVELLVEVARTSADSASSSRITAAGTPPTSVFGGTDRVTTAPAATTAPSPIVTPPRTVARAPSHDAALDRDRLGDRRPARRQRSPSSWDAVSTATS